MVQVLEGENAIARYRELMGKTNPEEAACGTIRALKLEEGSKEYEYLHARRKALHGYTPQRLPKFTQEFIVPELETADPNYSK